jgi:hypothetical protein
MDQRVVRALLSGMSCDITTTGRRSGQPHRIEIWYFIVDEQLYLTGTPGPRDWYANLLVHPRFIFHLKEGGQADLAAQAIPITDPALRRQIMGQVLQDNRWFAAQGDSLQAWVADSPLVRVEFDEAEGTLDTGLKARDT